MSHYCKLYIIACIKFSVLSSTEQKLYILLTSVYL